MRLKIQLFATWDELINDLDKSKTSAQNDLNALDSQKQAELDSYNQNYENQLNEYQDLMDQQQSNIDTWAEEQKKQQQAQTDFNINVINQNKEQAAKDTEAEVKDSYVDYMKQTNQYGGALENLASRGLATQGYSESSKVAMYNTYQNRVGTAKAALTKANTEYDNQIQQALLNNDANLAEIALQHMQQSYQIALQGFEYKQNMYNNKLSYETSLNEIYYNRAADLQSRIDSYNNQLASITQKQEENKQWWENFYENQRQFNESLAEEQRQYNTSMGISYDDGGNVVYSNTSGGGTTAKESDVDYHKRVYGNDSNTFNKKDYYFDNGYQPRYIYNQKVNKTGVKASEILSASELKALGINGSQNIWNAGGSYYVWVGATKEYKKVNTEDTKKAASWWDSLWHKGI